MSNEPTVKRWAGIGHFMVRKSGVGLFGVVWPISLMFKWVFFALSRSCSR